MAQVTIWHPETDATSVVDDSAVAHYRQSGWLLLGERDGWLAGVESGRATEDKLAAKAKADKAKAKEDKASGGGQPAGDTTAGPAAADLSGKD